MDSCSNQCFRPRTTSRRSFLKTTAAASAAAVLPCTKIPLGPPQTCKLGPPILGSSGYPSLDKVLRGGIQPGMLIINYGWPLPLAQIPAHLFKQNEVRLSRRYCHWSFVTTSFEKAHPDDASPMMVFFIEHRQLEQKHLEKLSALKDYITKHSIAAGLTIVPSLFPLSQSEIEPHIQSSYIYWDLTGLADVMMASTYIRDWRSRKLDGWASAYRPNSVITLNGGSSIIPDTVGIWKMGLRECRIEDMDFYILKEIG